MTAKKKTKKTKHATSTTNARHCARCNAITPELPTKALLEIAHWMLDLAATSAAGDRSDLASVERVRRFFHATIIGQRALSPTETDVLTVAALIVATLEHHHSIEGLGEAFAAAIDGSYTAPTVCGLSGQRVPRIAPHLYCMP